MKRYFLLFVFVCCLLSLQAARAQSSGGELAGTVTDSSGAAVVNAAVAVTNTNTGSTLSNQTSAERSYRFTDLQTGSYDVNVTASGFKTQVMKGVVVQISSTSSLNIMMSPGGLAETVQVNAADLKIQTALNNLVGTTDARLPCASFPATQTVAQSLRPYPQYFQIYTASGLENLGQNTYHALEAKFEGHYKDGLSLLASYTWAKDLTDSDQILSGSDSIQNSFKLRGEKSVSSLDTPNSIVVSWLYELPFGRNKSFLGHSGPVVSGAVSGWSLGSVDRYIPLGDPYAFGCAIGIPGLPTCMRYSQVPGQNLQSQAKPSGHFNPFIAGENTVFKLSAFVDPNICSRTTRRSHWIHIRRSTAAQQRSTHERLSQRRCEP